MPLAGEAVTALDIDSSKTLGKSRLVWPVEPLRRRLSGLEPGALLPVTIHFPLWVPADLAKAIDWMALVRDRPAAGAGRRLLAVFWQRLPLERAVPSGEGLEVPALCPRFAEGGDELSLVIQLAQTRTPIRMALPSVTWGDSIEGDSGGGLEQPSAPSPVPLSPDEAASLEVDAAGALVLRVRSSRPISEVRLFLDEAQLASFPVEDCSTAEGWRAYLPLRTLWSLIWRGDPAIRPPFELSFVDQDGTLLARQRYAAPEPRARGRIEQVRDGRIKGWAVADKAWGGEAISVSLLVNGVPFHTTSTTGRRADLQRAGLARGQGGFDVQVPVQPIWPPGDATVVDLVWTLSGQRIERSREPLRASHPRNPRRSAVFAALSALQARRPEVAVIVPIYNAPDEVEACVEALLRHTRRRGVRLILIDDCSPDPRIRPLLEAYAGLDFVQVVHNEVNLGYTANVNKGIALAGRRDVVFLNSDTLVTPRWIDNLMLAAYSDWKVATVTALSDNAGAFSVPQAGGNRIETTDNYESFARLVAQCSARIWPEVPTGNGFCLYVRRDCFDAVGLLDAEAFPRGYGEENDFCMRAVRAGWKNLIDDRSFVHHVRSASFGEQKAGLLAQGRQTVDARYPEYTDLVRRAFSTVELSTIRARVATAMAGVGEQVKRRILYVISKETGGTPQTNIDLMNAVGDDYETFVLRSDNVQVVLERHSPAGREILEEHTLLEPLDIAAHRSSDYDAAVSEWLVALNIDMIHVRHFAWHSLGLFEIATLLGIPVVLSFHDFYFVCPSIKLLDDKRTYCGGLCTEGEGTCRVELWRQDNVPPLKHKWVHAWRAQLGGGFESCAAFVTTSPHAKQTLERAFPELRERIFPVIPHGRDFARFGRAAAPPSPQEPLRVLVPGNIGAAKGADILKEVKRLDLGGDIEFHVVGNADKSMEAAGIILHGPYSRDDATEIFSRLAPHLGVILSIWPETYCHTLTELWAAGLPVLGFDIGAVGERLAEHRAGWLMPVATAAEVYEKLMAIRADQAGYQAALEAVTAWQEGEGSSYTTAEMARQYKQLYREIFSAEP